MEFKDLSQTPWHGIPRKEIKWYPKTIEENCIGCGLCYLTCGRAVYDFDFERKRPIVARPYNCMVGCSTCGTICTQDAIEFPGLGFIRGLVRKKKPISAAKKQIEEREMVAKK